MSWKNRHRVRVVRHLSIYLLVGAAVLGWWALLPSPLFRQPYATLLLDREGRSMGVRVAPDGQLRLPSDGVLPARYVAALLTFEDRHFFLHPGVDPAALFRALAANVRAGKVVSGGSTLTMQLVRMALGNPPRTLAEKIRECILSLRLEQQYSKFEILEMYAAHAPFGGNVVGIEAAALKYFDRRPDELSWAEAALLAVLPNAPSLIYPGKNTGRLLDKRNALLGSLFREGAFPEDTYRLALAEPLPVPGAGTASPAPILLDRAMKEHGGGVCRSWIDRHLQEQVNEIVERHTALLSHNYIYNMAVLVAHVPTGEVRAYVGNSPARKGSRGNRVDLVTAPRSAGSILKPFLYALMLDNGFLLPHTLVPDIPSRFGSYAPANFNRNFKGAVPASQALAESLNVPFVRMLHSYTYPRFHHDLKALGLTTLDRPAGHYGLSLILGGGEVTLWDVCNLYGGMASVLRHYGEEDGSYLEGEYRRLKLWDTEEGERQAPRSRGEIGAAAIWQTLEVLKEVRRPEIESGWRNFASGLNLSWKTGTSFGFRDAWAVGVNPEYVIGVWAGNADGEGRPGLVGVRAAAPVLFEVAALLPCRERFYRPVEETVEAVVCRKSGFRASPLCTEKDTVRICAAGLRTALCPYHRLVHLDSTGTWRVTPDVVPVYRMRNESWFVLPPVQEWYYSRTNSTYRKLPPWHPECRDVEEKVMDMVYPQPGTRVFIPRDFGGKPCRLVFEAVHRYPGTAVYWHADDHCLGMTRGIHQMELFLREGWHRLVLVDEEGRVLEQSFQVVGRDVP